LALAIGRKVVGYEIVSNREVVVKVAREALKSVGNLQQVTLKMNPQDLRFLEENQMSVAQLAPHISDVRVEAADSIEQGGCVIDSSCGRIDAQIDSQLKMIEKAFQTELSKRSETET
jgi:flagellar biosynthesis/type III secretory pathway protein FliH